MINPHQIRLHQLRALVAVMEHGSIRAAARSQHVSQAAITKSLKGLEDAAGVALIVRKASGVVLTDAGHRLMARARLVTRQIDLAAAELDALKLQAEPVVCVGVTPLVTVSALGEAFQWFRKRHPKVQVQVMEGLMPRVLPALRDGTLDFAIVSSIGDLPDNEFAIEWICREAQHVVARSGHPLAQATRLAQLADCEWVMAGVVHAQQLREPGRLGQLFAHARLPLPAMVARCDAMPAIGMVRSSDAVSVFPASLLAHEAPSGIVRVPIEDVPIPPLDLSQLSLADAQLSAPAAWFARCLRDACLARTPAPSKEDTR